MTFILSNLIQYTDCAPNIKKRRVGRGIQFYTLRDIQPGEELCISYSDAVSVKERLKDLERDWFFVCRCARCVHELEVDAQLR